MSAFEHSCNISSLHMHAHPHTHRLDAQCNERKNWHGTQNSGCII